MEDMSRKGYVGKVKVDEGERAIVATITTDAMDRDMEVVLPKGIDTRNWHKNKVVLWAHSYHELPVGKGVWLQRTENGLAAKWEPAPTEFGENVYELIKQGFLKTFSIGFLPKASRPPTEDDIKKRPDWAGVKRIFTKTELLEFSVVPVPSNPQALVQEVQKGLAVPDELREALEADNGDNIEIPSKEEIAEIIRELDPVEKEAPEPLMPFGEVFKPYPNEHACRLESPDKFTSFNRKNCGQKHDGKCIDVIYGIKDAKSTIQSLRYKKDIWQEAAAKAHCASREGTFEAAGKMSEEARLRKLIKALDERHKEAIEELQHDRQRTAGVARKTEHELKRVQKRLVEIAEAKQDLEDALAKMLMHWTGQIM